MSKVKSDTMGTMDVRVRYFNILEKKQFSLPNPLRF